LFEFWNFIDTSDFMRLAAVGLKKDIAPLRKRHSVFFRSAQNNKIPYFKLGNQPNMSRQIQPEQTNKSARQVVSPAG
jgi:hypothetical protein